MIQTIGRMSTEITVHEYEKLDLKGAMAVIGFPSVGLVSSIAANFMVKTMEMKRGASLISEEFPPYAFIHNGQASPPVRIYVGERKCGNSGEQCEKIIVITAEFMPSPGLIKPVVDTLLEWCRSKGVNIIITLEGINMGEDSSENKTLCVATGSQCKSMVTKYNLDEMNEGMVSGISGVLLYEAERLGSDVICLLGPARTDYPDARGAAGLLEIIGDMFPELKLDPGPLYDEAEQIEKRMKEALQSMRQPQTQGSLADQSMIYG